MNIKKKKNAHLAETFFANYNIQLDVLVTNSSAASLGLRLVYFSKFDNFISSLIFLLCFLFQCLCSAFLFDVPLRYLACPAERCQPVDFQLRPPWKC